MKKLDLNGSVNLEQMQGTEEWYWSMDITNGDLYEAQELFQGFSPHTRKCCPPRRRPDMYFQTSSSTASDIYPLRFPCSATV